MAQPIVLIVSPHTRRVAPSCIARSSCRHVSNVLIVYFAVEMVLKWIVHEPFFIGFWYVGHAVVWARW